MARYFRETNAPASRTFVVNYSVGANESGARDLFKQVRFIRLSLDNIYVRSDAPSLDGTFLKQTRLRDNSLNKLRLLAAPICKWPVGGLLDSVNTARSDFDLLLHFENKHDFRNQAKRLTILLVSRFIYVSEL